MTLPATPIPGTTFPIAATDANSVVTLEVNSPQIIINSSVLNSVPFFYRTASTAAEAVAVVPGEAAGDYPILPGTVQTFTKPDDHKYIGFITASGTAAGWVSPCMGE